METRYLLPVMTAALFVGGIILRLQGEGWLGLIGLFAYGMAVCLIIIQLLSFFSERTGPDGKPEQSKAAQAQEPIRPPYQPRR